MFTVNIPFKEPNPADYHSPSVFIREEWCDLVEACKRDWGKIDEASVKEYAREVWDEYWDKYRN